MIGLRGAGASGVHLAARDCACAHQRSKARQIGLRLRGQRARLGQLRFDGGDLVRAAAGVQVGRLRLCSAGLRLCSGGGFALVGDVQREQRRAALDLVARLHRQLLQTPGHRRGDVDVITLCVTRPAGRGRVLAAGQREQGEQCGAQVAGISHPALLAPAPAAPDRCAARWRRRTRPAASPGGAPGPAARRRPSAWRLPAPAPSLRPSRR